jgi:hypothetical protein
VQVDQHTLVRHIESVLSDWNPFCIRLNGLVLSFDRWLFLTIQSGVNDIGTIRLQSSLFEG